MVGLRQLIKLVLCSNLEMDVKVAVIEQMSKREKKVIKIVKISKDKHKK